MKKLSALIGWLFIIAGSIIAWGWMSHNIKVLEFFSYGIYIKFTTAVWFILAGVGLLFIETKPRISFYIGITLTSWALIAFCVEYIYFISAMHRILKWIIRDDLLTQIPAPNTCISFILLGMVFVINRYSNHFLLSLINLLISSIVTSLTLVAIIGYTLQISTAYGWSNLTQMSFLSAIGIFIAGLFFIYKYSKYIPKEKKIIYLPISSFIFIGIFSWLLWIAVYQFENTKIEAVLADHLKENSANVVNLLNRVQSAFIRFRDRMEVPYYIPDVFWQHDAASYIKNIHGVKSIGLLKNNKIKMFADNDAQDEKQTKENIFRCVALSDKSKTNYILIPNSPYLCFTSNIKNNSGFDFIVLLYDLTVFITPTEAHDIENWYSLNVIYDNKIIASSKSIGSFKKSDWNIKVPLSFVDFKFYLSGIPSKGFIKELGSNISFYLLIFSLTFAIMWSIIILFIVKEKNQEAQIKNLNKQLQLILDSSHMSIIATDLNGTITYFNHAAERILEYTAGEVVGVSTPSLFHDFNEVQNKSAELTKKLGRTIEPGFEVFIAELDNVRNSENEWTYIAKSGKKIPMLLSVTALRDEDDQVYGYLGIGLDIAERKEIERVKNEFISMVSHELRTPLTSIHGSIILLIDQIPGPQTTESLELLNIALNNTDRLIRLINDILDLEKIESGQMKFVYGIHNVNDLIKESILENQGYAKKFTIQLNQNLLPQDVEIKVDHDRMMQVLTNLISNAIKFSPQNGDVLVSAKKESSHVIITITDKGNGISPEFQKCIFNKFAQADSSPIRKQQGTGLGLNISKLIVETMGGSIYFDTEQNIGTSFHLKFDIYKRTYQENNRRSHDRNNQLKILHIEDDNDLYKVLDMMLKKAYFIEQANSVESAKKLLSTQKYQLVILDLKLQDVFAYELLPYINQMHIPIMVLTSYELPSEYEPYVKRVLIKSKVTNDVIIHTIHEIIKGI